MTYQNTPDPREGCFKNTAIIAVVILVSLIVLVMVIRSDAQPVASVSRETYVKPDSCFWEEVDITGYQVVTLTELIDLLDKKSCVIFVNSHLLTDQYRVKIRQTRGSALQILRDAIRGTDLVIKIMPPMSAGVMRKEEGL